MENKEILKEEEFIARKKLSKTLFAAVIAMLILILICMGYVVFSLFQDNHLEGSWRFDNDEAGSTLIFKNEGNVIFSLGYLEVSGTYSLEENSKVKINIAVSDEKIMDDTYTYKIDSTLTNRKLTLTNAKNQERTFTPGNAPASITPSELKLVEGLDGTFKNEQYNLSYEFKDDGNAVLIQGNVKMNFTYTASENEITLMQTVAGEVQEKVVPYTLKDNVLILNGLDYIKQ